MTARELSIGAGRVDDGERTVDSRSVELMTAREISIGFHEESRIVRRKDDQEFWNEQVRAQ